MTTVVGIPRKLSLEKYRLNIEESVVVGDPWTILGIQRYTLANNTILVSAAHHNPRALNASKRAEKSSGGSSPCGW